ncbi:MAG: putative lipid II flippase FtsW [Candidatus Eisenbacteria bacterium]|uniref:Probable peptidoglycan glycosyltransferase FtsW n=1 Tax=Eiseniibacteriota bacterium TaxID=2212470 RepID=A0A538ST67_UNCEI|nr:MAG: putative lipid II flippase FtsW [Candidatus Eisenbacteria bacterium]
MRRGDGWIPVLSLALTAVGVVMVYSSTAILGITRYQDPDHFLIRQLERAVLGVVAFLLCSRVSLKRLETLAPWLFGIAALLLAAVVVAGRDANGASRWLPLGPFSVQPVDIARMAAVLFLAWWLRRHPPAENGLARGVLLPLGLVATLSGLILLQPSLSGAALLALTGLAMLFLAGARISHLTVPVAGALVALAVALKTHPYQMVRLRTFIEFAFSNSLDQRGAGWQLDQSLIAIGSGGWVGRGLGGGLQKYLFLPEAHTDFIFSILAEELGFIGASALLVLFALLLWRGMRTAARASDASFALLAAGITLQFGLYAVFNLAVATGLAPTTGLPLPFVSYGGSALIANLGAAGVLYRISGMNAAGEALTRQRWASPRRTGKGAA